MSFDLAVWSHVPRSVKDARTIYQSLCEGDTSVLQPRTESRENVSAFLAELTARYPTSDAYSDDRVDACLWSSAFDVSDAHVLMSMPFSRAGEVLPFVAMLAEKHGLAIYNPQIDAIKLPPQAR